jgi:hypothetical protein
VQRSGRRNQDASANCWTKMSKASIEGLRQAFLDPGSRIRLNEDLPPEGTEEHGELLALTWEGEAFSMALLCVSTRT